MALKPLIAGLFYNSGGGGGGTIPSTTNLLQGDGAGNAASSGIAASNVMLKAVYDPANIAAQLAGRTVANIFSVNGAASTPAMTLAGTIFTGGSATTTKPQLLIEPTGTTSTAWSTSGTLLGLNAPNAFAGRIFDVQRDGVSSLRVLGATGQLELAPYSGVMALVVDGNRLSIGVFGFYVGTDASVYFTDGGATGTTDLILRRKAAATLQLGLDAAGVTHQMITAANRITSDGVGANLTIAPGNGRGGAGGSLILSTYTTGGAGVAGTLTPRLYVNGPNGMLQFGGQDDTFPAIKRSALVLQIRNAADTGYASIDAIDYSVSGTIGATAGPLTSITSITVVGGIVTDLQGT